MSRQRTVPAYQPAWFEPFRNSDKHNLKWLKVNFWFPLDCVIAVIPTVNRNQQLVQHDSHPIIMLLDKAFEDKE